MKIFFLVLFPLLSFSSIDKQIAQLNSVQEAMKVLSQNFEKISSTQQMLNIFLHIKELDQFNQVDFDEKFLNLLNKNPKQFQFLDYKFIWEYYKSAPYSLKYSLIFIDKLQAYLSENFISMSTKNILGLDFLEEILNYILNFSEYHSFELGYPKDKRNLLEEKFLKDLPQIENFEEISSVLFNKDYSDQLILDDQFRIKLFKFQSQIHQSMNRKKNYLKSIPAKYKMHYLSLEQEINFSEKELKELLETEGLNFKTFAYKILNTYKEKFKNNPNLSIPIHQETNLYNNQYFENHLYPKKIDKQKIYNLIDEIFPIEKKDDLLIVEKKLLSYLKPLESESFKIFSNKLEIIKTSNYNWEDYFLLIHRGSNNSFRYLHFIQNELDAKMHFLYDALDINIKKNNNFMSNELRESLSKILKLIGSGSELHKRMLETLFTFELDYDDISSDLFPYTWEGTENNQWPEYKELKEEKYVKIRSNISIKNKEDFFKYLTEKKPYQKFFITIIENLKFIETTQDLEKIQKTLQSFYSHRRITSSFLRNDRHQIHHKLIEINKTHLMTPQYLIDFFSKDFEKVKRNSKVLIKNNKEIQRIKNSMTQEMSSSERIKLTYLEIMNQSGTQKDLLTLKPFFEKIDQKPTLLKAIKEIRMKVLSNQLFTHSEEFNFFELIIEYMKHDQTNIDEILNFLKFSTLNPDQLKQSIEVILSKFTSLSAEGLVKISNHLKIGPKEFLLFNDSILEKMNTTQFSKFISSSPIFGDENQLLNYHKYEENLYKNNAKKVQRKIESFITQKMRKENLSFDQFIEVKNNIPLEYIDMHQKLIQYAEVYSQSSVLNLYIQPSLKMDKLNSNVRKVYMANFKNYWDQHKYFFYDQMLALVNENKSEETFRSYKEVIDFLYYENIYPGKQKNIFMVEKPLQQEVMLHFIEFVAKSKNDIEKLDLERVIPLNRKYLSKNMVFSDEHIVKILGISCDDFLEDR